MAASFRQVDKGGGVVYDRAGDGSTGYCDAVAVINPSDISGGSSVGPPTAGSLVATTTGTALGSSLACLAGVLVQNLVTNAVDILVGDSASQPVRLTPSQAVIIPAANVNQVFCKTVSSTATVAWLAV